MIARYRGILLGLAAGDALGTTLEFRRPGTFAPIADIVGGGPFKDRKIETSRPSPTPTTSITTTCCGRSAGASTLKHSRPSGSSFDDPQMRWRLAFARR